MRYIIVIESHNILFKLKLNFKGMEEQENNKTNILWIQKIEIVLNKREDEELTMILSIKLNDKYIIPSYHP